MENRTHAPDWSEWKHYRTLQLRELVLLSINECPHETIVDRRGESDFYPVWDTDELHKRLRVTCNLFPSAAPVHPSLSTIAPQDFTAGIPADWELPPEWPWPRTEPAAKTGDELKPSERKTLLKILFGMARAKYGYDPSADKNTATGRNSGSIVADLEKLGMRIDSKTVRDYLKEAAKLCWDELP